MTEHVLVIGAGIGGLCTALALAPTGRQITLLERDPAPPSGDADQAFAEWARRGAGHLRHSHAFLARLRMIIRDEHPQLLAELVAAGCRELGFEGMLTDLHRRTYRPAPVDQDFVILTSRRTTLELVIRRYVERQPNVTIRAETFVRRLLIQPAESGPATVVGVAAEDASGPFELRAQVVVDAGGRGSQAIEQLMEAGAPITEEAETAGILYFTRHYRLNPGRTEPPRGKAGTTGDLGFLKFGVFPADNGCFSVTLCVPEIELELRKAIVNPEVFDAICAQLPGLAPWTAPETAQAVSRVFGMGDLQSRWRDLVVAGEPTVLGFFALGDSLARTNPLYGRGCSFAAVGAYLLRDAILGAGDPAARLAAFHAAVHRELRPYYLNMRDQDRSAIRRARRALTPAYKPGLRARVVKSFLEDGVAIAIRSDPVLLREALLGFHMLEHPAAWLKRPTNIGKVLGYWAKGRRAKVDAYPPKPGPDRAPMMAVLGLEAELDIARVAAATLP